MKLRLGYQGSFTFLLSEQGFFFPFIPKSHRNYLNLNENLYETPLPSKCGDHLLLQCKQTVLSYSFFSTWLSSILKQLILAWNKRQTRPKTRSWQNTRLSQMCYWCISVLYRAHPLQGCGGHPGLSLWLALEGLLEWPPPVAVSHRRCSQTDCVSPSNVWP